MCIRDRVIWAKKLFPKVIFIFLRIIRRWVGLWIQDFQKNSKKEPREPILTGLVIDVSKKMVRVTIVTPGHSHSEQILPEKFSVFFMGGGVQWRNQGGVTGLTPPPRQVKTSKKLCDKGPRIQKKIKNT